jgi:hypothetical protein
MIAEDDYRDAEAIGNRKSARRTSSIIDKKKLWA